ncbi:MAG: TldD/PmbA family protein [Thermoplasmata archaeon]
MEDLATLAVEETLNGTADYADVRIVDRRTQAIRVKNDNVEALTENRSTGFGIRALVSGAWGFSSSSRLEGGEVKRVAAEAVRIARASALVTGEAVRLADTAAHHERYASPRTIDPWDVPLEEKLALLLDAQKGLAVDPAVKVRVASFQAFREQKTFASSEGSRLEQDILQTGAGMEALALGEGEVQRRSYPSSAGGNFASAGWEFVEAMNLPAHAKATAEEAVALLAAPTCPSGKRDIVLSSDQLALQVHESCGHPTELDRALGMEAAYAGTSFLTPDKRGAFRYGSEAVNIVADATAEGGLGSFAYDDEGVPAQQVDLIKEGTFVGYQSSRETATRFGEKSSGGMRADGWSRIPLIRMTNVNLLPGDWTLDELIADTGEGIFMETNRSWSIDDLRLNFQFATEAARKIRDGELGALLRQPTYTGITYDFWRSCDAVGNEKEWTLWGTPNCGKGQPGQVARVGHGSPPARFRAVQVGVV